MITLLAPAGSLTPGASVSLEATEAHHLRVRRGEATEQLRLVDGRGRVGYGQVTLGSHGAHVTLERVEEAPFPARLVLAVGAGEKDRFGWLAEKATELGVTDLVPIECDRTASVASRVREGSIERIQRRATEALKQCGGTWAPKVHANTPLARFLEEAPTGRRWVMDQEGAELPAHLGEEAVTCLIGPEGGFTAEELRACEGAGFTRVSLGRLLLRFETAGLAAASWVSIARGRRIDG
ncbi:MAG: RsmE family RNA methyltransferase [Gemmatimonadales bacterium]